MPAAEPSPTPDQAPTGKPPVDLDAGPNPHLTAATAALRTGHFAAARALLRQPAMPGDEAQRARILWRLSPDPMVAGLIAVCLAFFAYVALTTQH